LQYRHLPKEYSEAARLYEEKQFAEAATVFEKMLTHSQDERIYRGAIYSYLQVKNYAKAKDFAAVHIW